jgi:hypothetical protein
MPPSNIERERLDLLEWRSMTEGCFEIFYLKFVKDGFVEVVSNHFNTQDENKKD